MNGTKLMMINVDIKYNYLYIVIKYFFLVIYYSEFVHMEATPSFQAWASRQKKCDTLQEAGQATVPQMCMIRNYIFLKNLQMLFAIIYTLQKHLQVMIHFVNED